MDVFNCPPRTLKPVPNLDTAGATKQSPYQGRYMDSLEGFALAMCQCANQAAWLIMGKDQYHPSVLGSAGSRHSASAADRQGHLTVRRDGSSRVPAPESPRSGERAAGAKLGPPLALWRTLPAMQQRCEVCENFRPEGDLKAGRTLEAIKFGGRIVLLCRAHAGIAQNSHVCTFDELRELYTEYNGKRSYVPRRARITQAPSKSTGKAQQAPRSAGRRATDAG